MHILVLGGYGLIGSAIAKRLLADGHEVTGLGRSARKGRALLPAAEWLEADISKQTRASDWLPILDAGFDIVINASGALQNGLTDNVTSVQRDAVVALIEASERAGVKKFIQISAPDVSADSNTLFYRTKAAADETLKKSKLAWTIIKPGLVIAPNAYGGTSLVRMLAAFPIIQPIVLADTPIQTVSVDDVARAVSLAVENNLGGKEFDLVESESRSLRDLVLSLRAWLGFAKPRAVVVLPTWAALPVAKLADVAGLLGWRPALRTTALSVLSSGVSGDPSNWMKVSQRTPKSFEATLADLPSTAQERVYARTMLVFPLALIVLSAFWIVSGVIGLIQHDRAVAILSNGAPGPVDHFIVRASSVLDALIGVLVLIRPYTKHMCIASIFVSVGYLLAATVLIPDLWADPLGPLVKIFPAMVLALFVIALAEER